MVKKTTLKILLIFVLFSTTIIAYIQMAMGMLTFSLAAATIFSLLWATRRPRPKRELPCASVNCCHYLGNKSEDSS